MRALLKQPTLLPLPQGEHMCTENTNTRQEKNKTRNKLIDVSGKIVATTPSERIQEKTQTHFLQALLKQQKHFTLLSCYASKKVHHTEKKHKNSKHMIQKNR